MKLRQLALEGILGAPNGAFDFSTEEPTFVTGGAAVGKSSLLRSVILAKELVGAYAVVPTDPSSILKDGQLTGTIRASWELTGRERSLAEVNDRALTTTVKISQKQIESDATTKVASLFSSYTRDRKTKFEFFPANRRLSLSRWGPAPLLLSDQEEASRRLGDDASKYDFVGPALLHALRNDRIAEYNEALRTLWPTVAGFGSISSGRTNTEVGVSFDSDLRRLSKLSATEGEAVLFATAYAYLGLTRSIVIVDALEKERGSRAAAEWMSRLRQLGSGHQLIVVTTSDDVLANAKSVVDLGGRSFLIANYPRVSASVLPASNAAPPEDRAVNVVDAHVVASPRVVDVPPPPMGLSMMARSHEGNVNTTQEVDPQALLEGVHGPVPFRGHVDSMPRGPSSVNEDATGETTFMPALNIEDDHTMPFSPSVISPMPLERYASLGVLTDGRSAEDRAKVHRRYEIQSEEQRRRIDQEFGRLFRRDDEARVEYERLLTEYRARFSRSP